MLRIDVINSRSSDPEIETIRTLFMEYSDGLSENLGFQGFDDELENPLKKYGEPDGCLLLAYWNDTAAGCIALQPLHEAYLCEMKRLYVRNQYRNMGIGEKLIEALLENAVNKGYKKMVLDSLKRLQAAIKLYRKFGFTQTTAYYDNPLTEVVYMEKIFGEKR
jgi:putative acetyltransferase